jgi:hypothetical protein
VVVEVLVKDQAIGGRGQWSSGAPEQHEPPTPDPNKTLTHLRFPSLLDLFELQLID